MRKSTLARHVALIAMSVCISGSPPTSRAQDLCKCGPDYCLKDPRFPPLLEAKKKRLRAAGFSNDLLGLLDREGSCVAAIRNGPDTFFIKRQINGVWDTRELNTEREKYARADLLSGATSAYYKFNTNHAQECCGQPKFDKRSDWDGSLDLNLSLAIVCRKAGSNVECKNAK